MWITSQSDAEEAAKSLSGIHGFDIYGTSVNDREVCFYYECIDHYLEECFKYSNFNRSPYFLMTIEYFNFSTIIRIVYIGQ